MHFFISRFARSLRAVQQSSSCSGRGNETSPRGGRPRAFTAAGIVALAASLVTPVQAELLVLNAAGPRSQIKRFDVATGAETGAFGRITEAYYSMTVTPAKEVCVSSNILGEFALERFTEAGALRDSTPTGWMTEMLAATRGLDGRLYAIARDHQSGSSRILRIDGDAPGVFIEAGAGGLSAPTWMTFGPDGNLYVSDNAAGILRFSGDTGAPQGVVVPLGRGGLQDVTRMLVGPDGRLYVATAAGAAVLRFDLASGDFVDVFVAPGAGGLSNPRGMAFGPDGHLFVTSQYTHQVLRYDGASGAYLGVAAAVSAAPGDPRTRLGDIGFVDETR